MISRCGGSHIKQMNWTTELPTHIGHYWVKDLGAPPEMAEIVRVQGTRGKSAVTPGEESIFRVGRSSEYAYHFSSFRAKEWQGPLVPEA